MDNLVSACLPRREVTQWGRSKAWVTPRRNRPSHGGHRWITPATPDWTREMVPRSKLSSPRSIPITRSLKHIRFNSVVDLLPVFFRYLQGFDLQLFPEPTTFHPLYLSILVKDRANFINKVCSPNNRLQTYYRILGSKPSEFKDMVRPIWPHSTVTISVFEFSFNYSA
jgi:hypothetical protein